MNRIRNLEFWCFLLLAINLVTAGGDFFFRRATASFVPFSPGQMLPSATGIAAGRRAPARGASCHLVRYASVFCSYCAPRYSQAWNDLERTLTSRGCDATIISPFANDLPPSNGTISEYRLDAVSFQFAKSVRFSSTPATLVLDRDWKTVWSHVGVLDSNDSRQALRSAGF